VEPSAKIPQGSRRVKRGAKRKNSTNKQGAEETLMDIHLIRYFGVGIV